MSEINQIAKLLQQAIADRQTLTIGDSNAAVTQGSLGVFRTSTGLISAIATNFCYGDCLLAKVEGTWHAINPSDNREVVKSSVDRLIQRKPKTQQPELFLGKFIGTNSLGIPLRKLIYDFNTDLNAAVVDAGLPVNITNYLLSLDNIIGGEESDLAAEYWRVSTLGSSTVDRFVSIDSLGATIDYPILSAQRPQGQALYLGSSIYFALYSQNFIELTGDFRRQPLMRFYTIAGVETGRTIVVNFELAPPDSSVLGIYPHPAPNFSQDRPRSILDDYYQDVSFGALQYSNAPAGQLTGETYQGQPVTGIVRVIYAATSISTNSKIPIAKGHKMLARVIATPVLLPVLVVDSRYINWDSSTSIGTIVRNKIYQGNVNNRSSPTTISYDLDGLTIDLNQNDRFEGTIPPDFYTLVGVDTITLNSQLFGNFPTQLVDFQITETIYLPQYSQSVLAKTYREYSYYTNMRSTKVAIVTDRIRNCRINAVALNKILSDPNPEIERYQAISCTYTTFNDAPNPSTFRGLVFIDAKFFNSRYTIIVNSPDCYAKFYRTVPASNKLYALEFWVMADGTVDLVDIHERQNLAGEADPRFSSAPILYYPPSGS